MFLHFLKLLEKDHSMIETCRLKNVVIFIQTILSFVLSRKITHVCIIVTLLLVKKTFGALLTSDFSKTFDCLSHDLITTKLNVYGFSFEADHCCWQIKNFWCTSYF